MPTYVLRVWLPDRPGALGAVATRVGAVRGDVIGIDIIERGAGRAVDELVIDLPEEGLVDLLLGEIAQVDGVDVEDVRPLAGPPDDPATLALLVAGELRAAAGSEARLDALARGARQLLHADWAAVVAPEQARVLASVGGELPNEGWLAAFVLGTMTEGSPADLEELAVAPLADGSVLVVARGHLPLRGRERAVLEGLAALV